MSDFSTSELRRLDLTLLLVFLGLLRHRKAAEGARDLGLRQSAISQALKRLRDIFGDELFPRRPHGTEPTATAPALEAPVARAAEAMGRARRIVLGLPAFLPALAAVAATGALLTLPARLAPAFGLVTAARPLDIRRFAVSAFLHRRNGDARTRWLVQQIGTGRAGVGCAPSARSWCRQRAGGPSADGPSSRGTPSPSSRPPSASRTRRAVSISATPSPAGSTMTDGSQGRMEEFDAVFSVVRVFELLAGAVNITLPGLNLRERLNVAQAQIIADGTHDEIRARSFELDIMTRPPTAGELFG